MPRIVDLTRPLYPGDRLSIATVARRETEGFLATRVDVHSHAGTHMDAPLHFLADGRSLGDIPLSHLIGPVLVADFTHLASREVITSSMLAPWLERLGKGGRLIFKTGWSNRYGSDDYHSGAPRLGLDAATMLVEWGTILAAVESVAVADVTNKEETSAVHKILLQGGIVIIEGLCNLDKLSTDRPFCLFLPLSIPSVEGAPVRAVALEGF